tara:strand:+ start:2863 stop:4695 length:1833 start_codon:yes stop_codon:yes gene_type:complete
MANQYHTPLSNGLQSFVDASPDYEFSGVGIGSFRDQANRLAEFGRNGDIYVVHAAEGETVVPTEVLEANPKVRELLFDQMRGMGLDPQEYVVGSELNSLNPVTGMPEFFFKKIFRGIKKGLKKVAKVAKKIAPVVLPLAASAFGIPFLGPAFGAGTAGAAALGAGIGSLSGGRSLNDSLKAAALAGGTSIAFSAARGALSPTGTLLGGAKGSITGVTPVFDPQTKRQLGSRVAGSFGADSDNFLTRNMPGNRNVDFRNASAATARDLRGTLVGRNSFLDPASGRPGAPNYVPYTEPSAMVPGATVPGMPTVPSAPVAPPPPAPLVPSSVAPLSSGMMPQPSGPGVATLPGFQTAVGGPIARPPSAMGPRVGPRMGSAPLPRPAQAILGNNPQAPAEPFNLFKAAGKRLGLVKQLPAERTATATALYNAAKNAQEAVTGNPLSPEAAERLFQKSYEQAAQKTMSGTTALTLAALGAPVVASLFSSDDAEDSASDISRFRRPNTLLSDDPNKFIVQNLAPLQLATPNPQDLIVDTAYPLRANQGGLAQFPRKEMLVEGPGTEKSDDIPAMLSDGEFVLNARSVRGADPTGQGNRYLGAKNLYNMMRDFEMRA